MEREARLANVAGAVLVGGASQRMGSDKAHLPVAGVPAATRVARTLACVAADVVLVGGDPPADAPGRRVPDVAGPRCALRGLVGALSACDAERVLVVATDLPLIGPELLLALVAWPEADAVVACPADGPQPLCAVYRRDAALAAARRRLDAERLAVRGLLDDLDTRRLEGVDLAAVAPGADEAGADHALLNVNSPDDLARAEAWLRRHS